MFLQGKGQNGSYLVRNSDHSPGNLALSVRSDEGEQRTVFHLVIRNRKGKYDMAGRPQFSSIGKLIEHYRTPGALIDTDTGRAMELKFPFIQQGCT